MRENQRPNVEPPPDLYDQPHPNIALLRGLELVGYWYEPGVKLDWVKNADVGWDEGVFGMNRHFRTGENVWW